MQIELASGVDVSDASAAVAATDGGLYGPSSPAPPLLGPTPKFTGDGTTAAAVVAGLPAATPTGIGADAVAGLVATAAATTGLCEAAANAELNTAAASAGFCPSDAAARTGSRAYDARFPTPAAAMASSTGCSDGASAAADCALDFRAGSLATWQCRVRPSNTRYGSATAVAVPDATPYTNNAYPRDLPVSASKPNGPPSSSPNRKRTTRAAAPGRRPAERWSHTPASRRRRPCSRHAGGGGEEQSREGTGREGERKKNEPVCCVMGGKGG
jgi:hypothetical protein